MVWLTGGQKEGDEFENLESAGISDWLSGECMRERKDSGASLGSGSGLDSQQGWELWVGDPQWRMGIRERRVGE